MELLSRELLNQELLEDLLRGPKLLVVGEKGKVKKTLEGLDLGLNRKVEVLFLKDKSPEFPLEYVRASELALLIGEAWKSNSLLKSLLSERIPLLIVEPKPRELPEEFAGTLVLEKLKRDTLFKLLYLLLTNRALRRRLIYLQEEFFKKKLNLKPEPRVEIQIEGSFDSSYSLAIVNREVALALERLRPGKVSLFSTDGYGDFKPREDFLREHPQVKELYLRSQKAFRFEVVLRNPFPPKVFDMRGVINGTTSYGWEESEYPKNYLEDLNSSLDFLAVMSPYVAKIMRDNGLRIPIFVVGLGVDHLRRLKPKPFRLRTQKTFKFLHLSSCFPRKGIDLLLRAYFESFTAEDDCVLIVKTFPNPHHQIETLVEEFRARTKSAPEVEVINQDLREEEVLWLYEVSHCVVLPSRGEGFLLPAGEAMLLKKPVITTGFGGQRMFCSEETAFLLPFRLSWAKTHLSSPYSYWAEPDLEALKKLMRFFYETRAKAPEIQEKVARAYERIQEFTWEKVAQKILKAIEKVKKLDPFWLKKPVRVSWISSWNCRCGLAGYSERLIEHFSRELEVLVIGNKIPAQEILSKEKEKGVIRVWERIEGREVVREILREIENFGSKVVVIQHHYAYMSSEALEELVKELAKKGIKVFLVVHALPNEKREEYLLERRELLEGVTRVVVHSLRDLNEFTKAKLWEKTLLWPMPVPKRVLREDRVRALRKRLGLEGKRVVGTFGFLRPHKGIREIVKAFSTVEREFPELRLLLVTPLYPLEESLEERRVVEELIERLGLRDRVTLIDSFLPEEELFDYLGLMEVALFAYKPVSDSSSSAVRHVLSCGVPVICTPCEIFEDLAEVALFSKGFEAEDLAESLRELLLDREKWLEYSRRVKSLIEEMEVGKLARRFENIIIGILTEEMLKEEVEP